MRTKIDKAQKLPKKSKKIRDRNISLPYRIIFINSAVNSAVSCHASFE